MKTLSERIKYLFDKEGLNAYTFYLQTKFDQATMGRILKGETKKPSTKTIKVIANYFQVSEAWLLRGDVSPQSPSHPSPPAPDQPPEPRQDTQPALNATLSTNEMLSRLILTNERLSIQQGELIRLLAKDSDTLNRNSISIEQLSSKRDCQDKEENKEKKKSKV